MTSQNTSGGITFSGLLLVLFIGLKLTGYIAWSWWWVMAPMWAPFVVVLAVLLVVLLFSLVGAISIGRGRSHR